MVAPMLELPPAPAPGRPRMLVLGTALAGIAVFMLFAGLLGVFLNIRETTPQPWLPSGVQVPGVAVNTAWLVMVGSSVLAQWAVYAIARNDRPTTYLALGATVLFGIATANSMAFTLGHLGLVVGANTYSVLVVTILGAFLVLLGVGVVFMALMAFRTLGGRYSAKEHEGVVAAALFWHVVVAVFTAIWFVVFVLK